MADQATPYPDQKSSSQGGFFTSNILYRTVAETFGAFQERRRALALPNPGSVDNISREVQRDVLLNNQAFTGLRADLTKPFSLSPLFQVSHAFAMGAQGLPPYNLSTIFGTNNVRYDFLISTVLTCNRSFYRATLIMMDNFRPVQTTDGHHLGSLKWRLR
jgi:hypothetical protein